MRRARRPAHHGPGKANDRPQRLRLRGPNLDQHLVHRRRIPQSNGRSIPRLLHPGGSLGMDRRRTNPRSPHRSRAHPPRLRGSGARRTRQGTSHRRAPGVSAHPLSPAPPKAAAHAENARDRRGPVPHPRNRLAGLYLPDYSARLGNLARRRRRLGSNQRREVLASLGLHRQAAGHGRPGRSSR